MTEPQVWTLIGVFAAALFSMLTLMSTLFLRVVRTEIGGVRAEIRAEIGTLRGEIGGEIGTLRGEIGGEIGTLRGEIGALRTEMRGEINRLDQRFDSLERDVRAITRRIFGADQA